METWMWIVIVVVVAALAAALAYGIAVQRRSSQLKKRFGPEYDRAVDRTGSRHEAETELSDIAKRRDQLEIKPLPERARHEYSAEWDRVQRQFVEEPAQAVAAADDLIVSVMRERGYPVDELEDRTDFVSADYPDAASHYRSAHAIRKQGADASTEEYRQAFVHYRALFDEMLVESESADDSGHAERREPTDDREQEHEPGRNREHVGDTDRGRSERRP